jgi:hypothetical protein
MADTRPDLKIGSKLWNKWHIESYTVVEQTSRSWLVRRDGQGLWEECTKIPKNKLPDDWFLDEKEWRDWKWWKKNHYRIGEFAGSFATPAQLRQIADLVGWKEPTDASR